MTKESGGHRVIGVSEVITNIADSFLAEAISARMKELATNRQLKVEWEERLEEPAIFNNGMCVGGIPVGEEKFINEYFISFNESKDRTIANIYGIFKENIQCANTLLRVYVGPEWTHLLRGRSLLHCTTAQSAER